MKPAGEKLGHKKTRHTEEQVAFALKQAETSTSVSEVIRRMGISEQTFYRWKKVYGGLGVGEQRRLKLLEEENRKLKQLVADLSRDKHILQDVLAKKGLTPERASALSRRSPESGLAASLPEADIPENRSSNRKAGSPRSLPAANIGNPV